MSIKIPLGIAKSPDVELIDYNIIPLRIICKVKFEEKRNISPPIAAIIDTGAPLSVIPKWIWESVPHKILGPSHISGIVKGEIYRIESQIGIITVIPIDIKGKDYQITLKADFSSTNDVPLILGIDGFLDKSKMYLDIHGENSWIEFAA